MGPQEKKDISNDEYERIIQLSISFIFQRFVI